MFLVEVGIAGGILAGLLYLKLRSTYSGSNPIKVLIRGIVDAVKWPFKFLRRRRGRITGRGTVGSNRAWRCQTCTYDNNNGSLRVCEMCGTIRVVNGVSSFQRSSRSDGLPLDELRRRRIDRFGGRWSWLVLSSLQLLVNNTIGYWDSTHVRLFCFDIYMLVVEVWRLSNECFHAMLDCLAFSRKKKWNLDTFIVDVVGTFFFLSKLVFHGWLLLIKFYSTPGIGLSRSLLNFLKLVKVWIQVLWIKNI